MPVSLVGEALIFPQVDVLKNINALISFVFSFLSSLNARL